MPSLATFTRDLAKLARYPLEGRTETRPARSRLAEESGSPPLDVDRYAARVRAFHGDRFAVSTELTVTYRDRAHAILSVTSRAPASKTLLVLAGVHGDEQAGLLAIPQVLEGWSSEGVRLVVLTPVNPVGAAELSRFNADGYDINRDFVRFVTPEARLVRDVMDREKPDFVVSLHEGPQDGTFMFANQFVRAPLARALCDALSASGNRLATRDYFGRRLDPPGLAPSSAAVRALTTLWSVTLRMKATIGYSEDRGVPELVLESPSRSANEAARVRPHVDLVGAVAARIA